MPGVVLGPAAAKIKNWDRNDVLLVVCDPGTVAAGVFTRNRFCAAPVTVCRDHLARQHKSGGSMRALVVNAGNANAGTGESGLADAHAECVAVARLLGCAPEEVLPYSTGVIMEPLPVEKILSALPAARTAARADGWFAAASAIMTTDTVPKGASRRVDVAGVPVTVTGIAKGAGMIHPDMATMLAFMATDAPIAAPLLAEIVREVADVSFNGATVDGDTSTNDSFVLAATGKAKLAPITSADDPRLAPCVPRSRSARWSWRRPSCATARAPPSSSRSASKAAEPSTNAGASPSASRTRRWSRPPSSRPTPTSAASCARSATLQRPTPILRASRSGSTTCWSSTTAGARPTYREEDGQRVMKQEEITVRVDLGRGKAAADGVDLRLLARLRVDQRRLPILSRRWPRQTVSCPTSSRAPKASSSASRRLLPPPVPDPDWSKITAARWRKRSGRGYLQAIAHPHAIRLDDLVAVDDQKRTIDANTRQFVAGLPANNVLLTGSRGTGKSSLVKAMLTKYAGKGLRLIEVDKSDLVDLPDIAERVASRAASLRDLLRRPHVRRGRGGLQGAQGDARRLDRGRGGQRRRLRDVQSPPPAARIFHREPRDQAHRRGSPSRRIGRGEDLAVRALRPLDLVLSVLARTTTCARWRHGSRISASSRRQALARPRRARARRCSGRLQRGSRSGRAAWQFAKNFAGAQALKSQKRQ